MFVATGIALSLAPWGSHPSAFSSGRVHCVVIKYIITNNNIYDIEVRNWTDVEKRKKGDILQPTNSENQLPYGILFYIFL